MSPGLYHWACCCGGDVSTCCVTPLVAYYYKNGSAYDLWVASQDSIGWCYDQLDTAITINNRGLRIAATSDGRAHIVYHKPNVGLCIAKQTLPSCGFCGVSSSWDVHTVSTASAGGGWDLCIDNNDNPAIIHGGTLWKFADGAWTSEATGLNGTNNMCLMFDADNNPCIARTYYRERYTDDVLFARKVNNAWVDETVYSAPTGIDSNYLSAVMDTDGGIHCYWMSYATAGTDHTIYAYRSPSGGWSVDNPVIPNIYMVRPSFTSIVDSDGVYHQVIYINPAYGNPARTEHWWKSGGTWNSVVLPFTVYNPQLAIGKDGKLRVMSYAFDTGTYYLRIWTHQTDGSWEPSPIESSLITGDPSTTQNWMCMYGNLICEDS